MTLWADRNDPVGAHLLPDEKARLRKIAKRVGKSMSFIIAEAVTDWLGNYEHTHK